MHSALGDPARLRIADALALTDASPSELGARLGIASNLLAHHLGVLERAGIVRRSRSQADRRRTYLSLKPAALALLGHTTTQVPPGVRRVVFVCTENAARSQLAVVLWATHSQLPATSAGIEPARRVHPRTLAAARRHHLPLKPTPPRRLDDVLDHDDLVITVCDRAHEHMRAPHEWLHWSVPDPVRDLDNAAFDHVITELDRRLAQLGPTLTHTRTDHRRN